MSLSSLAFIGADLVALTIMVAALYVPRHSRKDLMAAYIGVNVGVLAVTSLLSTASVGAGLGLGLFGVLSIIRLRSTELAQHEVAYFFAALALGLLGGIQSGSLVLTVTLMTLVVASLWIGDHPALLRRNRHQVIMLDRALADEDELVEHLEFLLGATVRTVEVQRLDVVNDTTLVDVRFQLPRARRVERAKASSTTQRTVGTVGAAATAQRAVNVPATPAPAPPMVSAAPGRRAAAPLTQDETIPPVYQPTSRRARATVGAQA